jgi:putative membrane protein
MMWWQGGWSWAAWVAMTIMMLGFWALVIWAVTALVRGTGGTGTARAREAEEILAERFARGEIDENEFHDRRELLRSRR